jgi:histidinol-phosphate aminotransferase
MSATPYPIRPEVLAFEPYSPGLSIDEIRDRFGLDRVIKMASNENPLGASPFVIKEITDNAALVFRYAQSGNPRPVAALAERHGIPPGNIVPGNGSDESLDLLIRVCPTPGVHNIVACKPSFSMYRIQSRLCGVAFRAVPLMPDFSFDWRSLRAAVDDNTALVFITTPDNPSGWCPPAAAVEDFAASLPESCLLVVDEAYMDFCRNETACSLLPRFSAFPNLIILRTFSNSFGMAGIRLGYGIMPQPLADSMRSVHMPFSVNILAEIAGLAALQDTPFYNLTLRTVGEGRDFLTEKLRALGCRVYPSEANFIMFQPPESCDKDASEVFEYLLSRGLIIRPLKSYGLPRHLRVSIGAEDENKRFISLLREALV